MLLPGAQPAAPYALGILAAFRFFARLAGFRALLYVRLARAFVAYKLNHFHWMSES